MWMAGLMSQRKNILLENKIYENSSDFEKEINIFKNNSELSYEDKDSYLDVLDEGTHSLEISNWLELKI